MPADCNTKNTMSCSSTDAQVDSLPASPVVTSSVVHKKKFCLGTDGGGPIQSCENVLESTKPILFYFFITVHLHCHHLLSKNDNLSLLLAYAAFLLSLPR